MAIRVEQDGPAAIITMDWPERRNALGPAEAVELSAAIRTAASSATISGLVLTGNGAFCAGGDLKGAASRADMPEAERRALVYGAFQGLVRALFDCPVPTIAAVDGPAIGLGFDIALACDSRFIGPDGWLMQGWGRAGLIPGTGGEWLLRNRSPNLLWRLLESQPRIDGAMAERLRLGETTESGQTARERALSRARSTGEMARETLEAYVTLSRRDMLAALDENLAIALTLQVKLLASSAVNERMASILRKAT